MVLLREMEDERMDVNALIRPGERLDDLQCGGLRILQRPDGF